MTELDISHIRLGERPLIVCDVDDVVLRFIDPFQLFLQSLGHEFLPRSFRLHGNIVSKADGTEIEGRQVSRLIEDFFEAQELWQTPVDRVVETLGRLSQVADILFLTAMPPRFQDQRRRLLDSAGLLFPLLASEQPKGPIVHALHASRSFPVAFIDDMAHNLHSVREYMADCLLIHLMPDSPVHRFAPAAADDITRATDWAHAAEVIEAHFLSGTVNRTVPAA
ncbi:MULTISPECIES: hypothetical protein [Rhizobium]|uniref:hypothetical protein n=1 Tax=Rhizobium TaxID=379 RepID=UPI0007EA3F4C|nr:hypothetical protein AMK02_CH01668 [Rhizobium sp. N731]ANK91161.1 hypothetical protein AMK01_CH01668 [Rhizobium sp. N6212]ANK97192.1 hypothetical protein AMK00_CH01670 [Rhizobium sp. N621]ANL03312.1 hypothetical protein AMJ99_CH01738 [Rhizobium esperanzae]ANL09359.1 hypothetical protein AMJ98_CH01659 [Rhizobium sp. N1341]ANL15531.1 hypothetical protein AMJ97_CH01667 [Rhizobium sp. N1314]ANL21406.1 hypothetical protein AMJ96_CH01662 [Rhizobium sp. N113]ANM34163.1 hypothetical protein AMK04